MIGVSTGGAGARRAHGARASGLSAIWTVARGEVALQRRAPLLWLTMVLLVAWALPPLLWAPGADFPSLSPRSPTRWQDVFSFYNFAATWCALVAPLPPLVALGRDRGRRTGSLLWSRPLDAGAYVTGKALALALLLVPASAAGEALYWVLGSAHRGAPIPAPLVLVEWACVVAPVVLLSIAVTLTLSLALGHPAAALLCWWAGVFGALYAETQTLSVQYGGVAPARFPVHVGPYRLSADVGLYPTALAGCALVVIAVALCLVGAAVPLYCARERSSMLGRSGLLRVVSLIGAALALAATGAIILHGLGGTVMR